MSLRKLLLDKCVHTTILPSPKNASPINHKIHSWPMIFRSFLPSPFPSCSLAGQAETKLQLILNMWMNVGTWQCLIELDFGSNRMPTGLKRVFAYFLCQIIMRSRRTTLVKSVGRRPAASSFKRKKLRCGVKDDGHAHKCSRVARTPLMYL